MRRIDKQLIAILILLITLIGTGQAATPPEANTAEDTNALWDISSAFAGKPVNLRSGAETFLRVDLTIGSIHPIVIRRRYQSNSAYDSKLGYGWAINYDKRLYTYPDNSVVIRKECGWKRKFTFSGGAYVTPAGETGTLIANNVNGIVTYTYTEKDGSREEYDVYGRLSAIVEATGTSLVFTYELDKKSLLGLLLANRNQSLATIVSYDYQIKTIEEYNAANTHTGVTLTFAYDLSTGRLTSITDNTGRTVTYTHDAIGNLATVTGPFGNATYGYTDTTHKHALTTINEGDGTYTNTYDTQRRITQQTHATGVITIEYLETNKTRVTTIVKDPNNTTLTTNTRTVEFGANGQITKETDTNGNVTEFTSDSNAQILSKTYNENTGTVASPNLVTRTAIAYTYDGKGNVLTETVSPINPAGLSPVVTRYTYHPVFSSISSITVASVVNPAQDKNKVITNTYDTTGNLTATTETGYLGDNTPYTYTTTYTYDTNGKLTTIDGPRNDVTDTITRDYTTAGYISSITLPLIGQTTYTNHDARGNPQTVTDPNGAVTEYTYDNAGRVLTIKQPGDTTATQYTYIAPGCSSCGGGANKIDTITLPEGNIIDFDYDTYGNLITIKDSANNTINYTYDSHGNRLKEEIKDSTNTLQKTLSFQYDAFNRLKQIKNPDNSYTEYGYDFSGNRTTLLTPNASLLTPNVPHTTYEYDALNRLTKVIQPGTVTTKFTYNTNNNLTSVEDAKNNTTTYIYDDRGRVYQTESPDTGTTTYTYDAAGNMITKVDESNTTITYQYDALNRLTKIDYTTDVDTVYTYDTCTNGKGRLCTMTDASGTTTYEYTPKGQVKKETKTIDSITYVTEYTYDQNGNLKTMTYPKVSGTGTKITYNYTNDRVTGVVLNDATNLATNITYKPFGGMNAIAYGNGINGTMTYDNQYRITGIQAGSILNLSYNAYDNNGNITSILNNLDATKNKTFTYDALDRLSTATSTGIWGTLNWTYDGVGNRQTENATTYTYVPNSNKLSTVGSVTYSFDANGNTQTEGDRTYTYNQNQRLISVIDGGVTKGEYIYNGAGQRVKKTAGGVTTIYHYNLNGQLISESTASGAVTAEYVYLKNMPLAKIEGTNTYYYHNDHLATPQKMTDASGTVVWSADYKPFGEATITVNTITNNLRFPGQYYDAETGLSYNLNRDYNSSIGRYIEADPIGNQKGKNHLYVYVGNNPLSKIDPLGLFKIVGDCCDSKKKIETAVQAACSRVGSMISNPSLRSCIETSCAIGTIRCSQSSDPRDLGFTPDLIPWFFITRHFELYVGNIRKANFGDIAVHEWAHGCGWRHGDGGGVPNGPKDDGIFSN